tara:strand:- start:72 stop:527 length:456 start_codon:yes stop_codon:yes gene_type:complete
MSQREMEKKKQFLDFMNGQRSNAVPSMPKNLSELDKPEMIKMFKLMSVLETGSTKGWPAMRKMFIEQKIKTPSSGSMKNINANLAQKVSSKNISQEDIIMNEMNMDTNDIIEKINDGTVDIDAGQKELDKMQMIDGDMPGQGKQKQGNWRG